MRVTILAYSYKQFEYELTLRVPLHPSQSLVISVSLSISQSLFPKQIDQTDLQEFTMLKQVAQI